MFNIKMKGDAQIFTSDSGDDCLPIDMLYLCPRGHRGCGINHCHGQV